MNETKKYEIQQVSMNYLHGGHADKSHLYASSKILESLGFMTPHPNVYPVGSYQATKLLYLGAVPKQGMAFHVYYTGSETAAGTYKFVKQEGDLEKIISEGSATESHFHGGLGTTTFYGSNAHESWSFHCKPPPEEG